MRNGVMAGSRFAETAIALNGMRSEPALVRVLSEERDARAWRVQLSRLERADRRAPLVPGIAPSNSSLLFSSQQFAYAAGEQNTPQSPPRRENPVAGSAGDVDPFIVQIAWGMSTGAANRLIAHWPAQGGSVVVYGSYVEVFGGAFINAQLPEGELPVFGAQLIPAAGVAVDDAAELSIQQDDNLTIASGLTPFNVFYVPDFARRAYVTLGAGELNYHPRMRLEWFDDRGALVLADLQGSSIGAPPSWRPVPARAVLLRLSTPGANLDCGEVMFDQATAFVHWRVAP